MDKNGERYLVAIRAKIKSTGFLNEIGMPSEKWVDVGESYRTRDQIEKAIQTLKCALSHHPQYVRTTEHVLGNIFVCSVAYQLRSILKREIKK